MFSFEEISLVLLAVCKMVLVCTIAFKGNIVSQSCCKSLNVGNLVSTQKFWISDYFSDEIHIIFGDEVNNLYNCIGIKLLRVSCAYNKTACR